jgi:hypothetical protein
LIFLLGRAKICFWISFEKAKSRLKNCFLIYKTVSWCNYTK